MMQKSTTLTTILRVKKCHFHYDIQKISLSLHIALRDEKIVSNIFTI
jgi:hypothetical protein